MSFFGCVQPSLQSNADGFAQMKCSIRGSR